MSQKTAVVLLLDFYSTWNSKEKNRTDCCRSWCRAIQRGRQWCRDTHWPIIANSRVPRGSDWLARIGPCGLRGWEPSCNCTGSANHCQMPTGQTTPNQSYFPISIRGFMENNKSKMVTINEKTSLQACFNKKYRSQKNLYDSSLTILYSATTSALSHALKSNTIHEK